MFFNIDFFISIGIVWKKEKMSAIKKVLAAMESLLGNDKFFEIEAQIYWKRYSALLKVGFSKEEAIDILKSNQDNYSA